MKRLSLLLLWFAGWFMVPCLLEAKAYRFGLTVEERNHRLMVVALDRKSKAFEAGLRRGDWILGINGRRINDLRDLKETLNRLGNKSLFYISRAGYKKEILIQFQEDFIYDAGTGSYNIGLAVEEINDGLFVRQVEKPSVAYEGGLDAGDIIVGANGYRISKVQHLRMVLEDHTQGELVLYIKRDGKRFKTRLAMNPDFRTRKSQPSNRAGSDGLFEEPKSAPAKKNTPPTAAPKPAAPTDGGSRDGDASEYDKLLQRFSTDS